MEENRNNRRKTGLLLSILGVISLVLITAGVTYAFFSYAKEGQTENTITTGTIRFAYDETKANGDGILLEDALPMEDTDGKALTGEHNVFTFTVTSVTPSTAKIPYVVTVKKAADSTISDDQVKLYLVAGQLTGATQYETGNGLTLDGSNNVRTFAQLPALDDTSINDANTTWTAITSGIANANEKVLFTGVVPTGATNYGTDFTLRMWLNGDTANTSADYSPYEFMLTSVAGAANQTVAVSDGNNGTVNIQVPTATNTTAIDAEARIRDGKFITSTAYYALAANGSCSDANGTDQVSCEAISGATWTYGRADYERVAFVDTTNKMVYTRSQAVALNLATVDTYGNYTFGTAPTGYTTTEQYYQINGQTYTVKVNVYANGVVVNN